MKHGRPRRDRSVYAQAFGSNPHNAVITSGMGPGITISSGPYGETIVRPTDPAEARAIQAQVQADVQMAMQGMQRDLAQARQDMQQAMQLSFGGRPPGMGMINVNIMGSDPMNSGNAMGAANGMAAGSPAPPSGSFMMPQGQMGGVLMPQGPMGGVLMPQGPMGGDMMPQGPPGDGMTPQGPIGDGMMPQGPATPAPPPQNDFSFPPQAGMPSKFAPPNFQGLPGPGGPLGGGPGT